MKKLYSFFLLSGLFLAANLVANGQATPSCEPSSSSWEVVSEVSYGIDDLYISGYSGSTLSDASMTSSTSSSTGYLSRVGSVSSVNLLQGGVYGVTATWGISASHDFLMMWIDFNDDGTFQTSEQVCPTSGYPTMQPTIFNITIPTSATPGTHLMRLRGIWEVNATDIGSAPTYVDPCLFDYSSTYPEYWSGNVVDYEATIIALTACSGTPTAGSVSGPTSSCSTSAFTLSLSGTSPYSGLAYQWQSSSSGSTGSFTNISGATSSSLVDSESSATYYRCIVTCSSSSSSDTTAAHEVLYGICYCTPAFVYGTGYGYGCSDYMIVGNSSNPFRITGALGTSMSDPTNCTTSGYIDETSSSYTVSFIPGSTYNVTLGDNIYGYSMTNQMWIDFNVDGVFQSSETVGGGTWSGTTTTPTITIPTYVSPGTYRMRVIAQYNCCTGSGYAAYPSEYPCPTSSGTDMIYYGDARDYNITVSPPPMIVDSPYALNFDTVSVGLTSPALSFNISGTYLVSSGSNITISAPANFMVSTDGATWATSVSIPYSGTSLSATTVYVNFTPSSAMAYSDSLTITGGGAVTPAYLLLMGVGTYPIVHTTPTSLLFGTYAVGTYSPVQHFTLNATYLNPLSSNITVTYSSNYSYNTSGSTTDIISYTGGTSTGVSVPVYFRPTTTGAIAGTATITGGGILSPVIVYLSGSGGGPCSGTPTAGTASVSPSAGSTGTSFTLSLAGYTYATGLTYQWVSSTSPTGPWTTISGATDLTYTFTGISASTYYRCIVNCTGYGSPDTSTSAEALYVYVSCTPTSSSWADVFPTGSASFSYTGSVQYWTVPAGVTSISVDMNGAAGGDSYVWSSEGPGSLGGRVQCTLAVTPGQVLNIYVGGAGANWSSSSASSGGYNGGGEGGSYAACGGGATDIRIGGTGLSNRVIVAGGGGGGGDWDTYGGAGGGLTGGSGGSYGSGNACGGAQTGVACSTGYALGTFGTGGPASGSWSVGGGGGGWYGGNCGTYTGGGGGGGSSYTDPTLCTSVTHTQGYSSATGNGIVNISYATTGTIPTYGINSININPLTGAGLTDTGIAAAADDSTGYLDRTATYPAMLLYQTATYATSVTWNTVTSYQEVQVWIDFNNDGTFQTTEEVTPVAGYSTTLTPNPTTFSISIPSTAATGIHVMRVRGIWEYSTYGYASSSHLDPCLIQYLSTAPEYNAGDVIDYVVDVEPYPVCSATPTAGSAEVAPGAGGSSTTFTLSLSGSTVATGLTYQWASSSSPTGPWTNISGATTETYSFTGISANTYYHCVVNCTGYGSSATSTPIEAILMGCTPTASSWAGWVSNTYTYSGSVYTWTVPTGCTLIGVDMQGAAGGNANCSGTGGGGGRVQANLPVTSGATVSIYVGGVGAAYSTATCCYDATGGSTAGGSGGYWAGGGGGASDIRIGGTALSNRMIVAGGGGGGGYDCCNEYGGVGGGLTGGSGIYCGSASTTYCGQGGTQTAGGAGATTSSGGTGTLGTGGNGEYFYYGGAGGGGYYGGGGGFYGSGGGGSSYTDPSATSVAHTQGYNTSGDGSVTIFYPGNIPTNGINTIFVTAAIGSNLYDYGIDTAANVSTGYLDRTSRSPITLYSGSTAATTITWGVASNYQELQVWIDFNNDGIFQTSEEVSPVEGYSATSTPDPIAFNLTIPYGATTGNHIMRVRGIMEDSLYGYSLSAHLDPCAVEFDSTSPEYAYGDVVDYIVTIATPPLCSGIPTTGSTVLTPTYGNASTPFVASLTGLPVATGLTFQWQSSTSSTGPFSNISGATSATYSFTGLTMNTYFQCIVTCTSSGSTNTSPVAEAEFMTCLPTSSSWVGTSTSSFSYTGSVQYWTVPSGVSSISVDMQGAAGGLSLIHI